MKATEHSLYLKLAGTEAAYFRAEALESLVQQEAPEALAEQRAAILNALGPPLLHHTCDWRVALVVTSNGQLYREEVRLGHPAGTVFELNYCISLDTPLSPMFAGDEETLETVHVLVQDYLDEYAKLHNTCVVEGFAQAVQDLGKLFGSQYKVHLMEGETSLSITWFPKQLGDRLCVNMLISQINVTNTVDTGLSDNEYMALQVH